MRTAAEIDEAIQLLVAQRAAEYKRLAKLDKVTLFDKVQRSYRITSMTMKDSKADMIYAILDVQMSMDGLEKALQRARSREAFQVVA